MLRERRQQAQPDGEAGCSELIGLEAKLTQYEQGERFIAAVERAGGTALLDRAWEGPENLPTLAEIRDPSAGSPGSGIGRGLTPSPLAVAGCRLLARCTLPATGHGRSRARCPAAPTRSRCWCWRSAAGCEVTAVHVDHGLRPGSAAEADVVAAVRGLGAALRSGRCVSPVEPGPEPRGPGPGRAVRGAAGRRAHRPHRRRPGRDGAAQPAAGRRPRRPRRDAPDSGARCSACAAPRRGGSARQLGLAPVDDPSQRRPAVPPQPDPPRGAAAARRHRRARRRPRCSPARPTCCATTPTCSTRWRLDARPHRRARRWRTHRLALARRAVRRWLARTATRPTPPTVERVLAVARGEAVATETGDGRRVERHRQRLRLA